MPARSNEDRIDRLEQVVQVIAEDQLSLQKLIGELATEIRRGFDRVAQQFEETDRRMRQTDDRMRQTDDRMRQTDDRIGKLVIAIGELIRHSSVPPA
jgi:DNA repair exonuclease SbcCD ATPase subunit